MKEKWRWGQTIWKECKSNYNEIMNTRVYKKKPRSGNPCLNFMTEMRERNVEYASGQENNIFSPCWLSYREGTNFKPEVKNAKTLDYINLSK